MCLLSWRLRQGGPSVFADSKELLDEIEDQQANILRLQVEKEATELRKEELEGDWCAPEAPQTHSRD